MYEIRFLLKLNGAYIPANILARKPKYLQVWTLFPNSSLGTISLGVREMNRGK